MSSYSNASAIVDLKALRENYIKIKEYTRHSEMIAVVKADAYGHGAKRCAKVMYEEGCRFFAVATVDEALEIRADFPDCEILILGVIRPEAAKVLADANIIAALSSLEYAHQLSEQLGSKNLRCHLKLDTGMNRIGFSCRDEDFNDIIEAVSINNLKTEAIFSHFACSDMPESDMTDKQLEEFLKADVKLREHGIILKKHISNSAAALYRPDTHFDYVRCGIILYGLNPSDAAPAKELSPVMTFTTHVTHVHRLYKNESVGYGATFITDKDTKIATLPIGYADGFIRGYANGGHVLINGKDYPIVGRICMDQCMIDIGEDEVKTGDEVEVFGKNNSIDIFAKAAGTINYECTCLLSKRVERNYIN